MTPARKHRAWWRAACLLGLLPCAAGAAVLVDVTAFRASPDCDVVVASPGLRLTWPAAAERKASLVLNIEGANLPLIEKLSLGDRTVVERVQPITLLTVGERDLKAPAGWVAFFDNPPLRAHRTHAATLKKTAVRVSTNGTRTVVRIDELVAGGFKGGLEISVFRGSPLIFVEAVVSTEEDGRAILYDAGLLAPTPDGRSAPWADAAASTYSPLAPGPAWTSMVWRDIAGRIQRAPAELNRVAAPLHVAGRTLVAESAGGALAVFPPPHQYFYPLDFANNLGFAWYGAGRNDLMSGYGFGIRQPPEGDRIWVPWVNAPPRTEQRLGVFYLPATDAQEALEAVASFTRGDRYKRLPGYRTFTSHYHVEHALEVAQAQLRQKTTGVPAGLETPGFVQTFKARGVDIVHLGEFHVGSAPRMPARERLPLLKLLHDECARLSDTELLVLPGEEPNVHLGGHWMSFFPRPVYWVLNRAAGEPLAEEVPGYGTVYRVGGAADVLELMQREGGLMWTAHARIKGSRGFPDAYWERPFYRSEHFLGAAWKAMPADYSQPRLGRRVLDLFDDMANAGLRKAVLAEADLFRMEPDYESYGHMNINYLRLDTVPRFADGWAPVLEALRRGRFFASTGEVLLPEFTVGGRSSGEVLSSAGQGVAGPARLEAVVEGTFPLAFAEIITGDGRSVHRKRIDLSDTTAFAVRRIREPVNVAGIKWIRLEVWDIARNGAFTQAVWVE